MANNEDLVVKIKADIRSLQAGLRQAAKEADIAGKAMQNGIGGRMNAVQAAISKGASAASAALLGIGSAAVAAGGGFAVLFNKALQTADGLVKMSDKTGVGIEELQRLQYAAGQVGLGVEEMSGALNKFTLDIGKAQREGGKAAEAYEALGVALSDSKGPRAAEAVLLDVLRALEKMPDAASRAAAAQAIAGKSALDLGLLASGGAGGLDKLRNEAQRLGLVLGDDLVRGGDNAGDAMDRLKMVISTGLNKAVLQAAPDIEKFINELLADPAKMQETIEKFVTVGKAIAQVGVAAAESIGFVVKFAEALGEAVAEMVHGSDIPFEDEIQEVQKQLKAIKNRGDAFGLLTEDNKRRTRELTEELVRLTQAQQDYLEGGRKGGAAPAAAGAPAAPAAEIPSADGGEITVTGKGEDKKPKREGPDPAELALQQALSMEETERFVQGFKDEAAETDAARLDAKLAADRAYNEQREADLAALESATMDAQARELLAEQMAYDQRLAMLAEFSETELEAIGGYQEAKQALIQQHEDNVLEIRRQGLQSGLDLLAYIEDQKARTIADSAALALQTASTYSKKAFEINKGVGIANALVNTAVGVTKALELPFPLNLAAAATTAAAGFAQVQAIRSAKFGGGGASSSVAGAGNPNNTTQAGPAPPQIALTLNGSNFSSEQVRGLIGQINDELADGAKLGRN